MINGMALATYVSLSTAPLTTSAGVRGYDYYDHVNSMQLSKVFVRSMYVSTSDAAFENSTFTVPYSGEHTTPWDQDSIFLAKFRVDPETGDPGLNFGNLDYSADSCSKVLIKKRTKGDITASWVTIYEQKIEKQADFGFSFVDYTNPGGATIEYMYVPVIAGVERIAVTNEVDSEFDGWFLCEPDASYQIYLNGENNYTYNQQGATVVTMDRTYPYVVHNGKARYFTGTLKGIFYPREEIKQYYWTWGVDSEGNRVQEWHEVHEYDPLTGKSLSTVETALVYEEDNLHEFRRKIDNFLTDNKPKILKDFEGKIWLVDILENISIDTSKHYKAPVHTIPWTEIADVTSGGDLYDNGFSNTDYDKR